VTGRHARALLVFARLPRPGRVKTRLIPALGPHGATRLYAHLLERTLASAAQLQDTTLQFWCDPAGEAPEACSELAKRYGMTPHLQSGQDLGSRMHHALETALDRFDAAVLIGSDCPDLDAGYLGQAFVQLADHDVVIGPADDGGYILIGMKRAQPRLFEPLPWGTRDVLDQTRLRLTRNGCRWAELPTLRDIDGPEDLAHFPELAEIAGATAP
jgi:rSAM/selenodomain-associated transferase 1